MNKFILQVKNAKVVSNKDNSNRKHVVGHNIIPLSIIIVFNRNEKPNSLTLNTPENEAQNTHSKSGKKYRK